MIRDMVHKTLKSVKNDLGEIAEILAQYANDNANIKFCPIKAKMDTEGV